MKKYLLFLLSLMILQSGCSDNEADTSSYPVAVKTIDYSIAGTSYNWKNIEKNTVYIVRSTVELAGYISGTCTPAPTIDFEKYSLLLVQGTNLSGIESLEKQLQQVSIRGYELIVNVKSNGATVVEGWTVAVLIPQVASNSTITLDVKKE
jgi:hypothetical protein